MEGHETCGNPAVQWDATHDEHMELAAKYVFLTVEPELIENQDNESEGKDLDKVGDNSESDDSVDLDNLNDTDLVDVAGFAPL